MAWDKTLPASDQKLRTLAGVITDNFAAVQEGDETSGTPLFQKAVLLPNRSDAGIATLADPVVVGATSYVYSKEDVTNGVQEIFLRAPVGAIVPLTQGGRLGSDLTNATVNTLRFGTETVDYTDKFLPRAWGVVAVNGNAFVGSLNKNFVSVTGYVVDISLLGPGGVNFSDANQYAVFATITSGPINRGVTIQSKTATSFSIQLINTSGVGQTDCEVSIMLMVV